MEREQVTSKLLSVERLAPPSSAPVAAEGALALINERYALRPLVAGDVHLGEMALCNSAIDRTFERFSVSFLEKLATTIAGKAVLAHHAKYSRPLGRFYGAKVERSADGTWWLLADYYMLKSEENAPLRAEIDAGVVSYVSVGFRGGREWCDLCGAWWNPWERSCGHWPGEAVMIDGQSRLCTLTWQDPDGTAEAVEGSFVWLGAQYEAQVVKSLRPRERTGGSMELKEALAEIERLKSELAGARAERDHVAQNAERMSKELAEAEGLQACAADGEQYRADLVAEIGRLGRLVGAEKEARVVAAALAKSGVAELKAARDEYQARVDGEPATEQRESPAAERPLAHFGYGVL
jgi:hypothetical protein